MTPEKMGQLHAAAFSPQRGWSADEFHSLCASPLVQCYFDAQGFALTRTIADESELLTLAVDPNHRRQGIAGNLTKEWLGRTTAQTAFLEVAADNAAAHALYAKYGFAETGRRKGYYQRIGGHSVDAVLMQAAVTRRQTCKTTGQAPKTG